MKTVDLGGRGAWVGALVAAVAVGWCPIATQAVDVPAQAGEPADLIGSAYEYRADRPADQNLPEAWILLMQYANQPFNKPADPNAVVLKKVLCAFMWEEVRPIRTVELSWPAGKAPPSDAVSVVYADTAVGGIHTWWNHQAPARNTELRAIRGQTYIYTVPIDTFGILVVGNQDAAAFTVPQVRAFGTEVWKQLLLQIEWGFEPVTVDRDYDGQLEVYDGVVLGIEPLGEGSGVTMTGPRAWRSVPKPDAQRGVALNLLYIGSSHVRSIWPSDGQPEDIARTIVTVRTKSGSFSFLAADLEQGSVTEPEALLAPEYGFSVRRMRTVFGLDLLATQPAKEGPAGQEASSSKTIRQRVREHEEQTWDGAVTAMRPGQELPPMPKPEFLPAMQVEVPDERLMGQWNLGAWHLLRRAVKNEAGTWRFNDYPFAILASETYLILRALDLQGMHKEAADGLSQWLELPLDLPPPKGHFSNGKGVLSHAKNYVNGFGGGDFPEDKGGAMDSPHAMGPGAIGYELAEHYFLTGDKEWLKAAAPRLIANADWILRQRKLLSEVIPGGERLWCKGLQPAHQVTPDSGGMLVQFYESEAYYYLAVARLSEALADVDREQSERLTKEAESYRRDLLAAIERSILLTPVVRVRDGTYHSYIPFACYVRGFASGAWGWRRPGSANHVDGLYWDTVQSAAPLISPAGLLPTEDPRVQGFLDVLEDRLMLENWRLGVRTPNYDPQRHWFAHASWQYQCGLERHANIHLAADDPACFLRTWLNQYAVDIIPGEYNFREHTVAGPPDKSFEESAFLERFRNMLVMEDGRSLWLARATPRAWLEQGKRVAIKDAPTNFGPVDYEIVSDVEHGTIKATAQIPDRRPPETILLRLRHPESKPIRAVTLNGAEWTAFDKDKEVVRLQGQKGTVTIEAKY